MNGFLSTLENVLANSALRTGWGAVPFNGPEAPSFSSAQFENSDDVVHVDPAHPLIPLGHESASAADGSARAELEDWGHDLECAGVPSQNDSGPHDGPADAKLLDCTRDILAFTADNREKIGSGWARLREVLVSLWAVEADGRPLHEDLGTRVGVLDRGDEVFGAENAAIANLAFDFGIPAVREDAVPGEIDDRITSVDFFLPSPRLSGIAGDDLVGPHFAVAPHGVGVPGEDYWLVA